MDFCIQKVSWQILKYLFLAGWNISSSMNLLVLEREEGVSRPDRKYFHFFKIISDSVTDRKNYIFQIRYNAVLRSYLGMCNYRGCGSVQR